MGLHGLEESLDLILMLFKQLLEEAIINGAGSIQGRGHQVKEESESDNPEVGNEVQDEAKEELNNIEKGIDGPVG